MHRAKSLRAMDGRVNTGRAARFACAVALAIMMVTASSASAVAELPTWHSTYDWPTGAGYAGWSSSTTGDDPAAYGFRAGSPNGPGLLTWLVGDREYRPGGGRWSLRAPGTTRIASAQFELAYSEKLFAHHCLELGLDAEDHARALSRSCSPPEASAPHGLATTLDDVDGDPWATTAHMSVVMPPCVTGSPTACSKWIPALDPAKNGPFARLVRVNLTLVDDDLPTLAASGELVDLDGKYDAGRRAVGMHISAADAGAGVQRSGVERLAEPVVDERDAACDPTHRTLALGSAICPAEDQHDAAVDLSPFPEGDNRFRAFAIDPAGNRGTSDVWHVLIDRSGPSAPAEFTADFDEETGASSVDWTPGSDPALPGDILGSGVASEEYRLLRTGGGWSGWSPADGPGFDFDGVLGEQIEVEAREIDAVGNVGAIGHATLVVGSVSDCQTDDVGSDAIDAQLHVDAENPSAPIDAFTFTTPQHAETVLEALPADAHVVSLVERTAASRGDVSTSGLTLNPELTVTENLEFWNQFLRDDIADFTAYLESARANANTLDRAELDQALTGLDRREQVYDAYGGVPIKSVAIEHDAVAAQQVTDRFAGQLEDVTTTVPPDDDDCQTPVLASIRAAAGRAAAETRSADGPTAHAAMDSSSPTKEKNYRPNSYSPPHVRVGADTGWVVFNDKQDKRIRYNKISAAWRFSSSSNRLYWWRGPRRNDMERGVEVEVRMDQGDTHGGSFGRPPWGFLPAPDDSKHFEGVPGIWTANFRCAYPDDYLNDDVYHAYALTIGLRCRPRSNRFRYRWAHVLVPGDDNDALRVSVQPVHKAQHGHGIPVPFSDEVDYCESQKKKAGSCFFGDHGPPVKVYRHLTNGSDEFITPGSVVFER